MQNHFPWDEIPDSNVFPAGTFRFEYTKLEDGVSQSTNKRMFKGQFTCLEPENLAGMSHFENFVTGNDENLGGIVPGSMGTRALKQSLGASNVAPNNDVGALCVMVSSSRPQLMISFSKYQEKDGEYAGQDRNRVIGWHKIGEKPVQLAPVPGQAPGQVGQTAAAPAAPPVQAAAATPAPAAQPPVAAPAAPAAPAAVVTTPAAQTPVAPAAPAAPVAAPAPVATPPAPAAQTPPPTAVQTIPCNICGQNVPTNAFTAHVQRHQTDPNWDGVSP